MKEQIETELRRLQEQHDIKILYAVESGSRAWGFASTDSDWDVRFVYVHRPEWYFSIEDRTDNLEEILPNGIDLAGWELRKALKLFRKSNPPLLEWIRSPLVYTEQTSLLHDLRKLTTDYFNPKSCMYHYLSMAKGNYMQYLQSDMVKLKKYFYVLRPILACKWIEQTNSMAPVEFSILTETQVKDSVLKNEIDHLYTRKIKGEELDLEPANKYLNDFVKTEIEYFNNKIKSYKIITPDAQKLDELFRRVLNKAWE